MEEGAEKKGKLRSIQMLNNIRKDEIEEKEIQLKPEQKTKRKQNKMQKKKRNKIKKKKAKRN